MRPILKAAAQWELEGPLITGPMTSLKILTGLSIAIFLICSLRERSKFRPRPSTNYHTNRVKVNALKLVLGTFVPLASVQLWLLNRARFPAKTLDRLSWGRNNAVRQRAYKQRE